MSRRALSGHHLRHAQHHQAGPVRHRHRPAHPGRPRRAGRRHRSRGVHRRLLQRRPRGAAGRRAGGRAQGRPRRRADRADVRGGPDAHRDRVLPPRGGAGVPLPRMWHADPERGVMVMERLRGVSFEQAKKTMDPAHVLEIRRELGRISAAITAVPGERFGYPRRDGRTRSGSWRESFLQYIEDILGDATGSDRPLPRPAAEIRELVHRHAPLLDEVTAPALVHFDLWDGNVFVVADGDGWRVEGIIDGERAFYGDPVAELVSLVSFVPEAEAAAVLDGFLGRALTPSEQIRLWLYRSYLWLILIAETAVRGYPEKENAELMAFATGMLSSDLAELAAV
ncbi:phosphotransferase family protein [Catellatospora bangladeshensis]|uniref:phosphotransferase family protein n=1 Tax=Catellatospora bangladeshensis TaxID=310355 RepID=UPI0036184366